MINTQNTQRLYTIQKNKSSYGYSTYYSDQFLSAITASVLISASQVSDPKYPDESHSAFFYLYLYDNVRFVEYSRDVSTYIYSATFGNQHNPIELNKDRILEILDVYSPVYTSDITGGSILDGVFKFPYSNPYNYTNPLPTRSVHIGNTATERLIKINRAKEYLSNLGFESS